jgi:hypothetical protein
MLSASEKAMSSGPASLPGRSHQETLFVYCPASMTLGRRHPSCQGQRASSGPVADSRPLELAGYPPPNIAADGPECRGRCSRRRPYRSTGNGHSCASRRDDGTHDAADQPQRVP